ncbi:hypothetical protein [Salidesulfovibrio brasiliensis]|uniref:hypothetical protein n=1 Tax=Salidesulfovibrio brasiliensis TaxID=221711 RepID=UPI0006D24C92|nr:hypothetical protein [Salidesulfovibrio brasiliensis]
MNPTALIPAAQPIPVTWALFDGLLILGFWAHILLMNAVFGGGAIALVHSAGPGEPLSKQMSKKLPTMLALTINFGVAPLLFLQVNYGHFDYPGTILMGGWWLLTIPALLVAYYSFYIWDFKYATLNGLRRVFLGLGLLSMLYVAFMFVNNMTLMLVPEHWAGYLENGGRSILNLSDATLFPRFLHFMTGALAIGGATVAVVGRWKGREDFERIGLKWLMNGTLINMAFGLWFLIALPRQVLLAFMGGNAMATGALVVSVILAGLIVHATAVKNVRNGAIWAALTVLAMAVTRHMLRKLMLEPYFSVQDLEVTGQYSPMVMFFVTLALGLLVIAWMIRLFLNSRKEA